MQGLKKYNTDIASKGNEESGGDSDNTTPDKRVEITGGMRSDYAPCHSQRVITQDFKPARREEKYFGLEKLNNIA